MSPGPSGKGEELGTRLLSHTLASTQSRSCTQIVIAGFIPSQTLWEKWEEGKGKRGGWKYDGGGGEKLKMGEEGLEGERKIENWRGGLEVTFMIGLLEVGLS